MIRVRVGRVAAGRGCAPGRGKARDAGGLEPTLSDQSEGEDERLQEDVKLTFESDPGYQHRDLPGLLLGRANQRL